MEDWQYRFPKVSKAEWLGRVNTDLKGKGISTLQSEWWPGEIRHSLHHQEDMRADPIHLPSQLFNTAPVLTEWIDTRDRSPGEINKEILLALQYGAQSLILYVGKEVNVVPSFSEILEGVITEYVSICMEADNIFMSDTYTIIPVGRIPIRKTNETNKTPHSHYAVHIPATGNWTKQTAEILQQVIRIHIENAVDASFIDKCILRYTPDKDFYLKSSKRVSFTLSGKKILEVYTFDSATSHRYLECHIHPGDENDSDKYLIQASSSALAASMTGVHSICIQHLSGDTPGYYKRINRNIAHLLLLESEMYKGIDPLAGSYAIDFNTHKWSTEILDILSL